MVEHKHGVQHSNEAFLYRVQEAVGDEYTFLGEYVNAKTKLKVVHNKCGHRYEVQPDRFLNAGRRCPKCAGKYTMTDLEFREAIRKIVGDEYEFIGKFTGMFKKMEVTHNKCGHKYAVMPEKFYYSGRRCPRCSSNYSPTSQEFKEIVESLVGNEYRFTEDYIKSATPIKIRHEVCGNSFKISPNNFLSGRRCPKCVRSYGESKVAGILDELGIEYIEEWRIGEKGSKALRFDFYIPEYRACIEYDGYQHYKVVDHWGGEEEFQRIVSRDMIKNHYCHYQSIELLRIPQWKYKDTEEMVKEFIFNLKGRTEWRL